MKHLTFILTTAWAVTAAVGAPTLAGTEPPVVGANLVNEPYKQTPAEQEATFRTLQAAGVHVIRAGIPGNDQGLAFAQRAYAHGVKIEWLLGVYPDPGTPWPRLPDAYKSKGLRRGWPLSTANADAFKANIGAQLAELESKGVVLVGFELGNEINWTGFNADFPLPAQGRVLNENDLASDPEGRKIAQGYLRYLQTLAALKDIRDHSMLNRRTPIISGGLADLDDSGKWLRSVKADAVSVDATLHFLQANGLDQLVDGYGLHFYSLAISPGSAQGQAALRAHLELNGLTQCAPPGAAKGKPCWMTEWNFNGLKGLDACPIDDSSRIAMVREMRSVLHDLADQHRLGGSLYYTWQGQIHAPKEDHDSAFLCGALTESGRSAVAPNIADLMTKNLISDTHSEAIEQRPCDIYAAWNTPCIAAHSTVRSLYAKYTGALYQVKRASDDAAQDIGLLSDGYANAATQDAFCTNTTCVVTRIYDQSTKHNDLSISSGGRYKGPGPDGSDLGAAADALPVTAGGHQVYGVSISPGMGYRNNRTSDVAVNGKPEGMYMISSGTHFNSGCCFDYGNAEVSGTDTGAAHMDAVNVTEDLSWADCRNEPGLGVQADLENGLFHWNQRSCNPASNVSGGHPFISAWLKNNGQTRFALKWGNAQSGGLNTIYSGALPAGYAPMRQEGAIILGVGGDNSHASAGSFFEGVMTAGFPTDGADTAVQANIVAVGYGAPTGLAGTLAPGSEISLQATTACCTGDYVRNLNGAVVIAPITPSSAEQDKSDATWIVRRGLADNSCVSFESRNNPGDFLRQQNLALHMQPFDGTASNRADATFCPQAGKNQKGSSFHLVNDPTRYVRHYYGKVYVASDGDSTSPWSTPVHWSDDVSFIVGPPWSP